jgi:hypothetical protein
MVSSLLSCHVSPSSDGHVSNFLSYHVSSFSRVLWNGAKLICREYERVVSSFLSCQVSTSSDGHVSNFLSCHILSCTNGHVSRKLSNFHLTPLLYRSKDSHSLYIHNTQPKRKGFHLNWTCYYYSSRPQVLHHPSDLTRVLHHPSPRHPILVDTICKDAKDHITTKSELFVQYRKVITQFFPLLSVNTYSISPSSSSASPVLIS